MTTVLSDTFNRSATDTWAGGTVTWTTSGGAASDYDVDGAKGTHLNTSTNVFRTSRADTGQVNHRIRVTVAIDNGTVAGAPAVAQVWGRYTDANNYYLAWLSWTTGDAVELLVGKRVAGTGTTLASGATVATGVTAGQEFTIDFEVDGENLRAKAWPTLSAEPGTWTHQVTDSALTAGTNMVLASRRDTGNTNTDLKFSWDNLTADVVGIAVQEQDVYPPRVLISVTGLAVGNSIQLYRVVGGERTLVRAGSDDSVTDPSFLRVDAELPFGVPVSYVAVVNADSEYTTSPVTYTLPGGKVVVSDAITGAAAEVVILAWPEKQHERQSSTFQVGGRQVAVLGDLGGYKGDIELYTELTSSRDILIALIRSATEGTVQIRQPGGYDGVDSFIAVLGYVERRWSSDGSDQRRTHVLSAMENEGWAPALEATGFTLQDVADAYDGLTLDDLAGDFTSLLAVAQGDFSS